MVFCFENFKQKKGPTLEASAVIIFSGIDNRNPFEECSSSRLMRDTVVSFSSSTLHYWSKAIVAIGIIMRFPRLVCH